MDSATTAKLREDLTAVIHDTEELLKATAGQTGEKLSELRARAEGSLKAARQRLKDAGAEIEAKAREAARATDAYVHENPWTAVGIAAGIGFLIGFVSRRR